MAWIKFEKDLLTDPRVLRIARTIQARWLMFDGPKTPSSEQYDPCNAVALPAVTLALGALVRIWSLADTHLGEDDLLPLGFTELDDVVGLPGFCSLLPVDWIIEVDDNTVKLPDFHEHNGTEAKKKAVTQQRVARFRSRNTPALQTRNAPALPDQTRPDQTKKKETLSGKPDAAPLNGHAVEVSILAYLNEKAGRNYEPGKVNIAFITSLLKDGAVPDDLRAVVDRKCAQWLGDSKMAEYLRPATLFNRTKFAQYRGELGSTEDWRKGML